MSDIVISVENLGKKYRLGGPTGNGAGYRTLREDLFEIPRRLTSRFRGFDREVLTAPSPNSAWQDLWALRDVSFDVQQGDVVGIIGRNGAGKSTLLKILSRITDPTTGKVRIKGRVASLLEVGTGFHSELTGRENIYLNGAILGMSRAEIKSRFDEIVAFAEIEKFLDTPVKRYSSGMYVRLAFAVAAHLEPEILMVDEVLAVGDAAFQRKCIGKMEHVAKGGRTVLIVSHQMALVANLCRRCILLNSGCVTHTGDSSEVIRHYMDETREAVSITLADRRDRHGNGALRFTAAHVRTSGNQAETCWISGQPGRLIVEFENNSKEDLRKVQFSVGFDDPSGQRILLLDSGLTGDFEHAIAAETDRIEILLDEVPLMPGSYGFTLYAAIGGDVADWLQNAGSITVEPGDFFRTGRLVPRGQGNFLVRHHFIAASGQHS